MWTWKTLTASLLDKERNSLWRCDRSKRDFTDLWVIIIMIIIIIYIFLIFFNTSVQYRYIWL